MSIRFFTTCCLLTMELALMLAIRTTKSIHTYFTGLLIEFQNLNRHRINKENTSLCYEIDIHQVTKTVY